MGEQPYAEVSNEVTKMSKHMRVLALILNSVMLVGLLTDYNVLQYSLLSNLFLIGLSMTWIKLYDLVNSI